MKKAFLVYTSFVSRVVADENTTEEELATLAGNNLIEKINNDEVYENVEKIVADEEVPYDINDCNVLHLGYYNDIDAVFLNGLEPDKIVEYMKNHKGAFHKCDEISSESIGYFLLNKSAKITNDEKYLVIYDVADRFERTPLDLVWGNAENEFIDIYKIIK